MTRVIAPHRPDTGPVTPCGWLVEAVHKAGVPLREIETVLERQVEPDRLDRVILPSERYFRFFEWAADRSSDPDLGIHVAAHLTARDFGLLGYLLENSDTLGTWLNNLTTYNGIFSQDARIEVTRAQGLVSLAYRPVVANGIEPLQDIWCSIGMIVHTMRHATGCGWVPLRCRFTTPRPADTAAMEELLCSNLRFGQDSNCIEFPERDLALAIPGADPVLFGLLKGQADGILASLSQEGEIVNRLRLMITAHLSDGGFDTAQAARALKMSVRKLHRELAGRDTSFSKLRGEVVRETARAHLADPNIQITEIAHRLGFSETSAFTRAFKTLEGVTPREFRTRLLAGVTLHPVPGRSG